MRRCCRRKAGSTEHLSCTTGQARGSPFHDVDPLANSNLHVFVKLCLLPGLCRPPSWLHVCMCSKSHHPAIQQRTFKIERFPMTPSYVIRGELSSVRRTRFSHCNGQAVSAHIFKAPGMMKAQGAIRPSIQVLSIALSCCPTANRIANRKTECPVAHDTPVCLALIASCLTWDSRPRGSLAHRSNCDP